MPPVLKLLIILRRSLNLKLGRVFISKGWTPNSTNKLSVSIYRHIFKCIYHSLVVFTIVLLKFLLVSLNKSAFYVYLNLQSTVAHNCHIKTKCSHQIQITHSKFKSLTSNSNHSQQIQITHIKFKSLTANSNHSQQIQITHSKLKITHSKFKLLTANYKSTTANYKSFTSKHQIQIVHIKYKSLTANTNRYQQIQIWSV